ncbi:hypothetical protein BGY98DRAFT_935299 [Russula aff. rugulosa BPL654]|nr:hypothetical protein BGY98DRAFT_935299 [Russula aff. rugulosa BPL654]
MAETQLDNEHVMFLTSSATKTEPNPVIYVSLSVKEIIHMEQDRHIEKGCSAAAAAAGWVRGDSGRDGQANVRLCEYPKLGNADGKDRTKAPLACVMSHALLHLQYNKETYKFLPIGSEKEGVWTTYLGKRQSKKIWMIERPSRGSYKQCRYVWKDYADSIEKLRAWGRAAEGGRPCKGSVREACGSLGERWGIALWNILPDA